MPDNDIRCPHRVQLGQRVVEAIQKAFCVRDERKSSEDKARRDELWTPSGLKDSTGMPSN
jgi:hypothetical protein